MRRDREQNASGVVGEGDNLTFFSLFVYIFHSGGAKGVSRALVLTLPQQRKIAVLRGDFQVRF